MADLLVPDGSYNCNSNSYVFSSNKANNFIFLFSCSPEEVFNAIKLLKNRKSTRTSDIEIKFNKYANLVMFKCVSDLFDYRLREGLYPDSLKVAEVIPTSKKGDHDKTTNYRPISLLFRYNKIFEKLLCSRIIYFYLVRCDMLCDCELGFRKNCSTIFAINKISNDFF